MKLYVIRHGQTDWNVAGKCQGMTNIELNNTGIEQAKQASEQISSYKIDLIICSPLKRARKTAEIINEVTNCQIISDERIIERNCGNIEGTTKDEWTSIVNEDIDIINNYNLNWDKQNVEPIKDVCKRVWNLLDEIQEKYKDKKFAAGCSRDVIEKGAANLGWTVDELIEKTILAMREDEAAINEACASFDA